MVMIAEVLILSTRKAKHDLKPRRSASTALEDLNRMASRHSIKVRFCFGTIINTRMIPWTVWPQNNPHAYGHGTAHNQRAATKQHKRTACNAKCAIKPYRNASTTLDDLNTFVSCDDVRFCLGTIINSRM